MPDHFHALLTPSATVSLETAMQMIKGGSSRTIKQVLNYLSPVWQQGFHDRWIRDVEEYNARRNYIRENPIAARLASNPEDYLFSSASGRHEMDASQFGTAV
jgi:REP element-mobilizing transposase RayT